MDQFVPQEYTHTNALAEIYEHTERIYEHRERLDSTPQ